ncbi:MAG: CPBP family intramembrane metalloprotease [Lachnospiraceae bacterium]|nr:CPBP family intramembrane metalloprotease [Lachnospiraceae bacterium]
MESNNTIKNVIKIFVPFVIALLIHSVVVFFDIIGIFVRNCISNEKTVASKSIETIMSQDYTQPMNQALISAIQFSLYILIFGIMLYKIKKPSVKEGFFNIIKPPIIIFLIIGGIAGQFMVDGGLALLRPLFKSAFDKYDELVSSVTGVSSSWLMLLTVFLISPIAEEILFRGLVLTYSKRVMPAVFAIILQAFLFGLYHGNIIQGTYAFLMGLLLGFMVHKTDNLITCIVFHIALNVSILLVPSGLLKVTSNAILTTAISAVILTICIFFIFKKTKKQETNK